MGGEGGEREKNPKTKNSVSYMDRFMSPATVGRLLEQLAQQWENNWPSKITLQLSFSIFSSILNESSVFSQAAVFILQL